MVVSGLSYNSYQFIYIVFFLFNGTGYFWNEVKLIRQLCSIQSLNLALFWPDPFSVSSIVFRPLFPALTPCSPRTLFLTIKPRHFIFHWWFTFTHGFVCASILILFSLKLILILKPVSDIIVKLTHTHTHAHSWHFACNRGHVCARVQVQTHQKVIGKTKEQDQCQEQEGQTKGDL